MNATRRGFIATVDSALRPTGEHTPPAAGPRRREERAHGSRSGPAVRAGCRDLREKRRPKVRSGQSVWVPKTQFLCKSAHSQKASRVLALAGSGLRQTNALIEACSSDSSAA